MQHRPIHPYPIAVDAITKFEGENFFLSNFYRGPVPILWNGLAGATIEHVFQAAKAALPNERDAILDAPTPGVAKKLGRKCSMRPDWDDVRIEAMHQMLLVKFANPELATKLLLTSDRQLVEGNWWGDRFWGVDAKSRIGRNHLGEILMQIRTEIRG